MKIPCLWAKKRWTKNTWRRCQMQPPQSLAGREATGSSIPGVNKTWMKEWNATGGQLSRQSGIHCYFSCCIHASTRRPSFTTRDVRTVTSTCMRNAWSHQSMFPSPSCTRMRILKHQSIGVTTGSKKSCTWKEGQDGKPCTSGWHSSTFAWWWSISLYPVYIWDATEPRSTSAEPNCSFALS